MRTKTFSMSDALFAREKSSLTGIDVDAEVADIAATVARKATSVEALRAAGGFSRLVLDEIDRRFPDPSDPNPNELGVAMNPQVYRRMFFLKKVEEIRATAQMLTACRQTKSADTPRPTEERRTS